MNIRTPHTEEEGFHYNALGEATPVRNSAFKSIASKDPSLDDRNQKTKTLLSSCIRLLLIAPSDLAIYGFRTSVMCDSARAPEPTAIIKVDRISKGRTPGEKVYEFILPSGQWVETDLTIKQNQEVLIHHFSSSESVTVRIGGTSFPPLQKPGTIIPIYTSRNCATDRGVNAKVQYFCVQLDHAETIKLSASNSVRVGVLVRNR